MKKIEVPKKIKTVINLQNISEDILETARESFLTLDTDLRVTYANKAFFKTFHVTSRETKGKLVYKLGNGQWNIPTLKHQLEKILPKNNFFHDFEVDHTFSKIGRKIMMLNAQKLHRNPGEEPTILLAIEDITNRKTLEDELVEYSTGLEQKISERTKDLALEKARDEAILESIGDGLIVIVDIDKGGKIIYVNKAFEAMMGWKPKEVLNKYIVDVVPRLDKDGKVVPFKERIETKVLAGKRISSDIEQPFYYVRKDKTKFPVASVITPVYLDKKIIGAVETFRDITKERAVDKVKTEFASLVSHQLRTPFTTINWYLELLLSRDVGQLNEKQTQYMEEAYRACKRMVDLVNVLLNISRIEMGTVIYKLEQLDLAPLAEIVLKENEPKIKEKKLKVQTVYAKNIPKIHADPKQMTIVFQNLITNAIKYSLTGGKIGLKLGHNKSNITITLSDDGIGIPKEAQADIFTRFFRADNAKALDPEGTGLGLYIMKSIVEEMRGKIWFESKNKKGTTFHITLPIRRTPKKGE